MSYSITNLRGIEDSAPKFGLGDVQEARFAGQAIGAEQTGLSYQVVKAGQRQSFGHRHASDEEIYVVLSGSGRVRLDADVTEVGPMDAIRVAPNVTRAFEAGDTDLELLAFGTHHEGDAELIKDFWDS